jgi:hypothetical protein
VQADLGKISLVNHSNKIQNNMLYSTWSSLGTSFCTQQWQRAYKDVSSVSDNNFTCTRSLMSLNDNIYENFSCCNSLLQILLCMEYKDHGSSFTLQSFTVTTMWFAMICKTRSNVAMKQKTIDPAGYELMFYMVWFTLLVDILIMLVRHLLWCSQPRYNNRYN